MRSKTKYTQLGTLVDLVPRRVSLEITLSSFLVSVKSEDFANGIDQVCEMLKIPPHPDPQVRLEACQKLLNTRIGMKKQQNGDKAFTLSLQDHDFGFTDQTMDPVLKEAAKILRLVHLEQLRKLQSDINNTIELVQSVTANPKTDTKLGKVGR